MHKKLTNKKEIRKGNFETFLFIFLYILVGLVFLGGLSQYLINPSINEIEAEVLAQKSIDGIKSFTLDDKDDMIDFFSINITNLSDLENISQTGDGKSWESAFIIENFRFYSDNTTHGLRIENITDYLIIRNCYFHTSVAN
ncbi:hypothetical protein NEF87_004762 [Candidatus Lokiarchaeum ossiferum]|uniref:Uncharacterized protein n=1 Tax=Candidatus Lokiarchaeum ossiferum TaxID=2951803 RepID=A0ABY6I027_9ARCH|nr:hypothetical protein NEF87_004762 [Candidatus Lokiarchaeum sp. B-35]